MQTKLVLAFSAIITLAFISCSTTQPSSGAQPTGAAPLVEGTPIVLPGAAGHFDFMKVDANHERLLAAHKGTKTLLVVDLASGKILRSVKVGEVQGVAVASERNLYFAGDEAEKKVVEVDSNRLKPRASVRVTGPVDAIAYDPKNGYVYADEDDGSRVWVIDFKKRKVVATISIPGEPEDVGYDPSTDRVYQNIKTKDELVAIDPAKNQVVAIWSTLPATSPHGLSIDEKRGRAYVAGGNGKLVSVDLKAGSVLSTAEIAPHVDQIAFDTAKQRVYCAGRQAISVVGVSDAGLRSLGSVPSPKGAHTIAVDAKTSDVWVSYADQGHSYLMKFTPRE